jgi:AcrR family transcriptional regulator
MSTVAGNLTRSRRGVAAPAARARQGAGRRGEEHTDGRRLRAARNRDSVVSAVLEIIREQGGGPLPGAAEVAVRAGVSERTVFRHFADLDSLFLAAAGRQRPVIVTYLGPRPDFKELDKRISALVKLRSKLYEEIAPVRRVAVRLAAANDVLAEQVGEANKAARVQVAAVFEQELARAGSQRSTVLDQLDLVTSWAAWEMMRTLQGASADRARKTMTELLTAVLKPLSSTRRSR